MKEQVKERPILFSGPMVRAILAGRKTMTRRVVAPQPNCVEMDAFGCSAFTPEGHVSLRGRTTDDRYGEWFLKCKYGVPGDRFWVRETWAVEPQLNESVVYRATDPEWDTETEGFRWRPSIHMPRWASRITLKVTEIRIERLQAISEADAQREGWDLSNLPPGVTYAGERYAQEWFRELWNGLNAGRGYGWDANPWVWVIGFKVLEVA